MTVYKQQDLQDTFSRNIIIIGIITKVLTGIILMNLGILTLITLPDRQQRVPLHPCTPLPL